MMVLKTKFRAILMTAVFLCLVCKGYSQKTDIKILQAGVKTALEKGFPASVFLIDYLSGPFMYEGFRSSGVVVKDGFILTAGHATVIGKKYRVIFPDGKELTANGWAKIPDLDAGVLKINEEGDWPYSEMGFTSSLKANDPCVSVAYPGSFHPKQAVIRFGHIVDVHSQNFPGMTHSTCVMEPGDSGGPLFDLLGRVIGIRSTIYISEEDNFDVPIDVFRKYWNALELGGEFKQLPKAQDIPADPFVKEMVRGSEGFEKKLHPLLLESDAYAVNIKSKIVGKEQTVLATVLTVKGINGQLRNKEGLLISKSSLVGDDPMVTLKNGSIISAKILSRDPELDLVLLQVTHSFKKGVNLFSSNLKGPDYASPGSFIFSAGVDNSRSLSVVGTQPFSLKRTNTSRVIFGASLEKTNEKIFFKSTSGPAVMAGLKPGDQLISIDDYKLTDPSEFAHVLSSREPGDTVTILSLRDNTEHTQQVILWPMQGNEGKRLSERFAGGKSQRRDGFTNIFAHDTSLKPSECGGPVFDLQGNFLGINIARYSRTSSLTMTASDIRKFVEGVTIK
ncbi:MAG: trypsin-like peptidase domain-containing protein [Ginsengibacter sp.]